MHQNDVENKTWGIYDPEHKVFMECEALKEACNLLYNHV